MLASAIDSHASDAKPSVLSGTYVLSQEAEKERPTFHPVSSILSSLPRPDLLLLSASLGSEIPLPSPLPVSPYPAHAGTAIRAHFVVDTEPNEPGWHPWIGGLWSKWVRGTVLGYRDFAGREAQVRAYRQASLLHAELLVAGYIRRAFALAIRSSAYPRIERWSYCRRRIRRCRRSGVGLKDG